MGADSRTPIRAVLRSGWASTTDAEGRPRARIARKPISRIRTHGPGRLMKDPITIRNVGRTTESTSEICLTRYSAAGCLQPVGCNRRLGGVEFITGHTIRCTAGFSRRWNTSAHVIATTRSKLANSKGAEAMPENSRHHPAMPGNTAMAM